MLKSQSENADRYYIKAAGGHMRLVVISILFIGCTKVSSCGRQQGPNQVATQEPNKVLMPEDSGAPPRGTQGPENPEIAALRKVISTQQETIRQRDIEIWYFLHASNRKSDFNDRFKPLIKDPSKLFMVLIETIYDGDRVEYFVTGDESFARSIIANYQNTGEIDDVGQAVKRSLSEDSQNKARFYFTQWSGLKFKEECAETNPTLANQYKNKTLISGNCTVDSSSPRYEGMKKALTEGTHYDLTKVFVD
jgi:hypothetical protein